MKPIPMTDKLRRKQVILLGLTAAIVTVLLAVTPTQQQLTVPQASAQTPQQSSFPTDITQDIQVLTITGKDKSGNDLTMELVLGRGGMMMMNPMMMSNPNWMFGMMGMMGASGV